MHQHLQDIPIVSGFIRTAAVVAFVAAPSLAAAQQAGPMTAPPSESRSQTPPSASTTEGPGSTAGGLQSQAEDALQSGSGKAGKEEPASHVETTKPLSDAVLVNGMLAVPGAPTRSETEPAKFSERNAELDKIPTMARPLPLNDEQRRRILDIVNKAEIAVASVEAKPAQQLPSTVDMHVFPDGLVSEIPAIGGYKFVKLSDKVLLVRAPEMIVIGQITPADGQAGQ